MVLLCLLGAAALLLQLSCSGFHTIQWMFGCELGENGLKAGFNKFGYDGKEALSFEKDTLTWAAYDAVAQEYKREWESEPGRTERSKHYLEEKCIGMLRQLLEFNKKEWQRRVAPAVKVVHKGSRNGAETLVCHIHGFYPKEIDATWRKNGEVLEAETLRGNVVPNSDGTYYTWLSIEIDPKEKDQYQCAVEHDSLLADPDPPAEKPERRRESRPLALNEEMRNMNPPRRRRHVVIHQEH